MAEKDAEQPEAVESKAEQTAADNGETEADAEETAGPAGAGAQSGAAEEAQQGSATPNEGQDLEAVVAQLQRDVENANEAALRAQADAQNVRRRAEQDVEKAHKFALEAFCKELLPVADNLERSVEAASGDDPSLKPILEGVELTLRTFLDVMARFNIEQVNPEGEPFDPQLHQAMSTVPSSEVEPNTVVEVMQKGYTLNGRLVRPAMVMVSKAEEARE